MADNKKKDVASDVAYEEQKLASYWNHKFKEAYVAKDPFTRRWLKYWEAYYGDYFKSQAKPEYKSDLVSNYIFGVVETIRPIMLDGNPNYQIMARNPEAMAYTDDVQQALAYEYDRMKTNKEVSKELITALVIGTAVFFVPYDKKEKKTKLVPVNPYNFFTDPLATTVENSDYNIYADYFNVEELKEKFPQHEERLVGGSVKFSEFVNNKDKGSNINNQVLVLEIYTKDYEREESLKGSVKIKKSKYPNGRVLTICPELNLVLRDEAIEYDDGFPFVILKDYDVPGQFWGEGEVAQLLSPQIYMNEMNNAILDNAKATANMPWVIDKNAGVAKGSITSRPGLIIRKNPGSEVKREQPGQMPNYVINAVETYKSDISEISGVFNSMKGNSDTGVYTAQGILALQEAGQARVRLKVKLLEEFLTELGYKVYNRMKQFWKEDQFIKITKFDGSYDLKMLKKDKLMQDYDIKVTSGSTMPVNRSAMLDLMVRLAQTPMPDGQNLVDREAVVHYLPEEVKASLMKRMEGNQDNFAQLQQQMAEMQEGLQQALQQITTQFQEFSKQSEANDSEIFDIVEDLTTALEKVNKDILQLQQEHDIIEKDKQELEKENKIRKESYNSGFKDAESAYTAQEQMEDIPPMPVDEEITSLDSIPDEMLQGIEEMTDEELELLIAENPELAELINQESY